jgi:hypothetical protein
MYFSNLANISASQKTTLDRLGYWVVDSEKIFINKVQACVYANQHHTRDIKYHIGNFDNVDWTHEPAQTLESLYKARAEQLREKYKYLVLAFSGGADSIFMLNAFVKNNIYPDQVVSFSSFRNGYDPYVNTNSEVFFNQKIIQELVLPNKIPYKIIDHVPNYQKVYHDPEWIYRFHSVRSPHANTQGCCAHKEYWPEVEDGAIVFGIDKPNIIYNNGWQAYFLDNQMTWGTDNSMYYDNYSGLAVEKFYITADLPELTVKQSYCVADYFSKLPSNTSLNLVLGPSFDTKTYKQITTKLLYGDVLDRYLSFSIGKTSDVYGYRDTWFWQLPDTDSCKSNVLAGWQLIQSQLDASWYNNGDFYQDLTGYISNFYTLGH